MANFDDIDFSVFRKLPEGDRLRHVVELVSTSLLGRKIKTRKGYISYRKVVDEIVCAVISASTYSKQDVLLASKQDPTELLLLQIQSKLYQETDFPVFEIGKDLMQSLSDTHIPESLADLIPVLSCGVILLPRNTIFTPDNIEVTEIFFHCVHPGEKTYIDGCDRTIPKQKRINFKRIYFPVVDMPLLRWGISATRNRQTLLYGSSTTLVPTKDNLSLLQGNESGDIHSYPDDSDLKKEQDFVAKITRIAANFLVFLTIEKCPLSLESVQPSLSGVGFKNKKSESEYFLAPRQVGLDFHNKYSLERSSKSFSDSSGRKRPVRHFRRGHFRQLEGKRVFVRPTYVCDSIDN